MPRTHDVVWFALLAPVGMLLVALWQNGVLL